MHEFVVNGQTGWINEPEEYETVNNGPFIVNNAALCYLFQEYEPVMNEDDGDILLPTPPLIAPQHSRRLTRNEEAQMDDGQHGDEEEDDENEAYFAYDDEDELDGAQMIPPAINWAANSREQRTPQRKRRACGCNHQTPVNNRLDDDEDLLPLPTMNW